MYVFSGMLVRKEILSDTELNRLSGHFYNTNVSIWTYLLNTAAVIIKTFLCSSQDYYSQEQQNEAITVYYNDCIQYMGGCSNSGHAKISLRPSSR